MASTESQQEQGRENVFAESGFDPVTFRPKSNRLLGCMAIRKPVLSVGYNNYKCTGDFVSDCNDIRIL